MATDLVGNVKLQRFIELLAMLNHQTVDAIKSGRTPVLEKMINQNSNSAKNIILELSGVEGISDVGLKALFSAHEKMQRVGSLKLIGVKENIAATLRANGLTDILAIN